MAGESSEDIKVTTSRYGIERDQVLDSDHVTTGHHRPDADDVGPASHEQSCRAGTSCPVAILRRAIDVEHRALERSGIVDRDRLDQRAAGHRQV